MPKWHWHRCSLFPQKGPQRAPAASAAAQLKVFCFSDKSYHSTLPEGRDLGRHHLKFLPCYDCINPCSLVLQKHVVAEQVVSFKIHATIQSADQVAGLTEWGAGGCVAGSVRTKI